MPCSRDHLPEAHELDPPVDPASVTAHSWAVMVNFATDIGCAWLYLYWWRELRNCNGLMPADRGELTLAVWVFFKHVFDCELCQHYWPDFEEEEVCQCEVCRSHDVIMPREPGDPAPVLRPVAETIVAMARRLEYEGDFKRGHAMGVEAANRDVVDGVVRWYGESPPYSQVVCGFMTAYNDVTHEAVKEGRRDRQWLFGDDEMSPVKNAGADKEVC